MSCVSANAMAGVSDCGLHHHRVAKASAVRSSTRNGDREIPRRDQPDHTERLAISRHVDAGPRRVDRYAVTAQRFTREEFEKCDPARATSPMPSGSVLPSSRDNRRPSSSLRASRAVPTFIQHVAAHFRARAGQLGSALGCLNSVIDGRAVV